MSQPEETLDPDDWDAFRALAHRAVDDMVEQARTVRERPVWTRMPDEVRARLRTSPPQKGRDAEEVYEEFLRDVLPYNMGNGHPRFWGWVVGTGFPVAALADYLASSMNPNLAGGDHAAAHVEQAVLGWCKEVFGFPPNASGVLVSGGSMANLTALAVARSWKTDAAVRSKGLKALPKQLVAYGSEELHSSVQRALDLLGIGSENFRKVPVDDALRVRVPELREAIERDRRAGFEPFCIVGGAGTTTAGSIDPLDALADVAREQDVWFHVDGAFGALARLSPKLAPRVKGMERADSLTFDLHKWGSLPMGIGGVLVRDPQTHARTFREHASYLAQHTRGLGAGSVEWSSDYGIELSRGFRGLKAWMGFQVEGLEKVGRTLEANVAQADRLASRVRSTPELELMAPVALNIVCFRFADAPPAKLDAINHEVVLRIQESGFAMPSEGSIRGATVIRCAIANHRTRFEDVDAFVDDVVRVGREVARG